MSNGEVARQLALHGAAANFTLSAVSDDPVDSVRGQIVMQLAGTVAPAPSPAPLKSAAGISPHAATGLAGLVVFISMLACVGRSFLVF